MFGIRANAAFRKSMISQSQWNEQAVLRGLRIYSFLDVELKPANDTILHEYDTQHVS